MPSTEYLAQQMRDYALDHYHTGKGWELICHLSQADLIAVLAGATSLSNAYRLCRAYIRSYNEVTGTPAPAPKSPATSVPKMSGAEFKQRLAPQPQLAPGERLKCWELVIEAFGVTGKRTGRGEYEDAIIRHFTEAGYKTEQVGPMQLAPEGVTPTLAVFLKAHLKGDWVVFTRSHVLAIRDGVIYDRDYTSSVKKVVTSAYRVCSLPKGPVPCDCKDPVVFGHWLGDRNFPRCPLA